MQDLICYHYSYISSCHQCFTPTLHCLLSSCFCHPKCICLLGLRIPSLSRSATDQRPLATAYRFCSLKPRCFISLSSMSHQPCDPVQEAKGVARNDLYLNASVFGSWQACFLLRFTSPFQNSSQDRTAPKCVACEIDLVGRTRCRYQIKLRVCRAHIPERITTTSCG